MNKQRTSELLIAFENAPGTITSLKSSHKSVGLLNTAA
ncbi:hypothetical protein CU037_2295 [Enterococcus faecium]|nr:hypothetical protein [Enterococcus faecium]MBK4875853.1 hypothetical protein [Enterococcus faecium]